LDGGLEDLDPDVEPGQLDGWGSALACGQADGPGTDDHRRLVGDERRRLDTVGNEKRRLDTVGDERRRLDTVDEALERGEDRAENGRDRAGSPAPSTPPSLLIGGHSGADGLENAIIFESNMKLDLYCLYIHSVGSVMYQTFLSSSVCLLCVCLLLQDLVQSCLHGGGGGYGRTCATRDDEPRPVWTSLPITH
jgi:hypothetical protein